MTPGDSSKENTIQGMEKGEPSMIDAAKRNKTVIHGDGVKSIVRTPRPTKPVRIGDWVMYTHKSEMVILGECVGKVENGVKVRDWLSDEIVNYRAIIEVRRRA